VPLPVCVCRPPWAWRHGCVVLLTLLAVAGAAPVPCGAQPLTVSVASSLSEVMADVGRAWQAAGGPGVILNAAGSNVLARQIAQGAPVHVFVSADRAQMEVARASGRLVQSSIRDVLSNVLVVIVPAGKAGITFRPGDLAAPGVRRLALGNPDSVPAGVYAREWLDRIGLWSAVTSKVVPTLTVRAALAAVRAGRADAGVVFATDAKTAPDVVVVYTVPAEDAPVIRYPAAVVRGPREADAARFVQFLSTPPARAVFEAAGFVMVP